MSTISIFTHGFISGLLFFIALDNISKYYKNKKITKDVADQFSELLNNLRVGKTKFTSRVNDVIYIETKLKDWKDVKIILLLDKQMVCIFKEEKCLYTSDLIETNLKTEIIQEIYNIYSNDIDDTIDVMGYKVSKNDFKNKINEIRENFSFNLNDMLDQDENASDVDKIINENDNKLDLNDILDKINDNGYESLSEYEKTFLDHISKEKNNGN